MRRLRLRGDRGSAAVEFALVLPALIVLIFGIVETSLAYNAQVSLSNAAREGARTMSLTNDVAQAQSAATGAAPSLNAASLTVTFEDSVTLAPITTCPTARAVRVDVKAPFDSIIHFFFPATINLTGTAVMRCAG